ncbi:hypothetical protein Lpl7_0252 [Lacticaseibacillus paracasei subsp. tolerans Lpl7]|nr:hypothetical protein Lpl7_0252 [Lacticaseibacillus paracasei subsp. tolerans Lpl7]
MLSPSAASRQRLIDCRQAHGQLPMPDKACPGHWSTQRLLGADVAAFSPYQLAAPAPESRYTPAPPQFASQYSISSTGAFDKHKRCPPVNTDCDYAVFFDRQTHARLYPLHLNTPQSQQSNHCSQPDSVAYLAIAAQIELLAGLLTMVSSCLTS